jgi:hypothetical protein
MTYAFEFRLSNVQEGSEEAEKEMQRLKGVSTPFLLRVVRLGVAVKCTC